MRTVSFVVHATRGVVRDQNVRRKTMFVLLIIALGFLIAGTTFLQSWLNPREHLVRALVFWLACLWLALTAMLLALFDFLVVRREGRRAERKLRRNFPEALTPRSPSASEDE